MIAVVGGVQVPVPSRSQSKRVKSTFEEIIHKNGFFYAQDPCWKHVISQRGGTNVIKAAKVFYKRFKKEMPVITLEFSDGFVILSKAVFEGLKKDTEIFKNLPEFESDTMPIDNINRKAFLEITDFLYGKDFPKKEPSDLNAFAIAAHYLNCKKALDFAFELFKKRVSPFRTEEDLESALAFYKTLKDLPSDLRDPVAEFMAPYFGRVLYTAPHKTKLELVNRYNELNVSSISFEGNDNLQSTILALTALHSLRCLNLSQGGTLAGEFMKFIPRGVIRLSINSLVMNLPSVIKLPMDLLHLDLSHCNVTDEYIPFLPRGLKSLILSNCRRLTNASLIHLPRTLTSLSLKSTFITKLRDLPPHIEELDLSFCNVSGEEMQYVNEELKSLIISYCTKLTFKGIERFKQLIHLEMKALAEVGCCGVFKKLETLNAIASSITNESLADLSPTLTALKLGSCKKITDESVKKLPESIESLDLKLTKVTDAVIPYLPFNLKLLDLRCANNITVKSYKRIPRNLVHFKVTKMTNKAMKHLPKSLESLDISSTEVRGEGYAHLRRGLKSLNVSFNPFSDSDTKYLPDTLERLELDKAHLSNAGLANLPKSIRFLDLSYCSNISNRGMIHLSRLEVIDLTGCFQLDDDVLKYLSRRVMKVIMHDTRITQVCAKIALPGTVLIF